jgi:hypothetical protein
MMEDTTEEKVVLKLEVRYPKPKLLDFRALHFVPKNKNCPLLSILCNQPFGKNDGRSSFV